MAKSPKPMRIKGAGVEVQGMKEFRKAIRREFLNGEGPDGRDMLKAANRKVAEHVKDRSESRASAAGNMQHLAWASMKVGNAQNKATLTGGAISQPVGRKKKSGPVLFFSGAEFGAYSNMSRFTTGRGGKSVSYLGWGQFKDWKKPGSGNTGYFLFPTMRDETEQIKEIWGREFDSISSKVFPDGR